MPRGKAPDFDCIVTDALRLPEGLVTEVRNRLETNRPTEDGFLDLIAQVSTVPRDKLQQFAGKPLRELYSEGVCGGAIMEFQTAEVATRMEVPMAFQSAFAGVLLAAEAAAEALGLRDKVGTVTQIDMLNAFPPMPTHPKQKIGDGRCICEDADFIDAYNAKYGDGGSTRSSA